MLDFHIEGNWSVIMCPVVFPCLAVSFIPDYSPTTAVPAAAPQAASSSSAQVAAPTAPLPSTSLAESYQKPVGSTPRGSGIEWDQLPSRYRRRPLDDEEMGYIMVSLCQ